MSHQTLKDMKTPYQLRLAVAYRHPFKMYGRRGMFGGDF